MSKNDPEPEAKWWTKLFISLEKEFAGCKCRTLTLRMLPSKYCQSIFIIATQISSQRSTWFRNVIQAFGQSFSSSWLQVICKVTNGSQMQHAEPQGRERKSLKRNMLSMIIRIRAAYEQQTDLIPTFWDKVKTCLVATGTKGNYSQALGPQAWCPSLK